METKICAIIISYNCNDKILLAVENIINQVDKIVIIDNGSNVQSKNILSKLQSSNKIEIIYNKENMGIAYALNQGVRYAQNNDTYEWIITLDQDSIATKNMIYNMLDVYNNLDDIQKSKVVSIVPNNIEEKNYNNGYIYNSKQFDEVLTEITSGNLVKVVIFDKIGYFDEKLFIDCVDHDFCFRICQRGFKIIKVYDAVLLHNLGNITTKKILSKNVIFSNHSFTRRYYITRNRLYIWHTYGNNFTEWTKNDKKAAILDLIMIILYEKDKVLKLKMIIKGYMDFKKKRFEKLQL